MSGKDAEIITQSLIQFDFAFLPRTQKSASYEKKVQMHPSCGRREIRYCVVSAAEINGETYICVIMGDSENGRFSDSLAVYKELDPAVTLQQQDTAPSGAPGGLSRLFENSKNACRNYMIANIVFANT